MDSDQQQKDIFSSFFPEQQQQQQQQYSAAIPIPASPVYNAFTPSSPQSTNSQLAMNMLLMQMQGLGDSSNSTLPLHQQQQQQQQGVYQPPNQQHPQQLVLEHQFKLTQLQQLQQLQNTILQHQFALISGQSPPSLPMSPLAVGADQQQQQQQQQQSSSFGLPTPGPSAELRPLQASMDFSPINIGYSMTEPSSSASSHHPSPSPQFPPQNPNSNNYGHHTPSDGSYSPLSSAMGGQFDIHSHNQHQHQHHQHQPQFYHQPGTNSAPEHIAFRRRSPTDVDLDISPLTSPWLGAHQHHPQQSHQQQQQLQSFATSKSNKRTASSSGDESSSRPSRKKQSPAIRPTLAGTGPLSASSNSGGSSVSPSNKRNSYRASKSTTSTPLLRSARSRRGSTIGTSMIGGEVVNDTPSPVDLSMPPPAPPSNSDHPEGSNSNNMDMRMEMGGMMMMEMAGGGGGGEMMGFEGMGVEPRLTPVTPASIMNLGRLGLNTNVNTGNGNNNDPSQVSTVSVNGGAQPTRQNRSAVAGMGKLKLATTERGGKGSRGGGRGSASALISPSLKPILPAGSTDTPMSPTSPATAGGTPPLHVRKTSHKAAEQKRRDSLKTTFDDLRGLLPPIALPELPSPADDPNGPVTARPLLPGALPPRGPPKAGGEGPNKGVSKLQLLICGNEYIRTLKGRVERRDAEIGKLRKEVARLRERVGFETDEQPDLEMCDLEKDLDVCEIGRSTGGGIGGQAQMRMGGSVVGDDEDDDGDD